MNRIRVSAILVLLFGLFAGAGFAYRVDLKQAMTAWTAKRSLPKAVVIQPIKKLETNETKETKNLTTSTNTKAQPAKAALPIEFNIAVPFTPQAPYAVWDAAHEDACEEASMIMLADFQNEIQSITKKDAEEAILKLLAWENDQGYGLDVTAEEAAQILRDYFGLKNAKAVYDITIDEIKKEIAAGHPVIVPAAGKLLPNPNFRNGGPIYHMLVIKGYTKDGLFITNDPGTRLGADFTYTTKALYNAIHDWVGQGGDMAMGRKAMVVVE